VRQIEIQLSEADRQALQAHRTKGQHPAREVTRAHILAALDQGRPDLEICRVLGVSRMVVWRTRSAYLERGLAYALAEAPRSGAPTKYGDSQQAEIVALACSEPPPGRQRWTVALLTQAAREQRPELEHVSTETVRQCLKKKPAAALA
jgi:putative transposase